jgi:hypothetical protein
VHHPALAQAGTAQEDEQVEIAACKGVDDLFQVGVSPQADAQLARSNSLAHDEAPIQRKAPAPELAPHPVLSKRSSPTSLVGPERGISKKYASSDGSPVGVTQRNQKCTDTTDK